MYRCVYCGKQDFNNPTIRMNVCEEHEIPKKFGFPTVKSMDFLPDYGNVSRNRIKEMGRRVILKDAHPDRGSYYVGRMGENGKIQDRVPNTAK